MRDPVQILIDSSRGRVGHLILLRYERMAENPFAFFRGAAAIQAHDLMNESPNHQLVQACGDAHLGNFGVFATPERRLIFDINDFDETFRAPWTYDIKRLVASFEIDGRDRAFKRKQRQSIVRAAARSYQKHMSRYAKMSPLDVWYDSINISVLLDKYRKAASVMQGRRIDKEIKHAFDPRADKLVDGDFFRDNPPLIYHPDSSEGKQIVHHLDDAFVDYVDSLPEGRRTLVDRYTVSDVAVKVVGVGSVGTRCGILLLKSGSDSLVLQVKEARASIFAGSPMDTSRHQGERIVIGQRMIQAASDIFLGWSTVGPYHFYIRQLRDVKIKPQTETYTQHMMVVYAEACGWALARAHARTGFPNVIRLAAAIYQDFPAAMVAYAEGYADQNFADYRAFLTALDSGPLNKAA